MNPRIVEVRRNILKKNDVAAAALRERFQSAGIFVTSLVSSPGAGKTAFLERTLTALRHSHRVAALVGDLATECDADRLRRSGAPARQITTGTVCHLDAEMIARALESWPPEGVEWLFIENVGNLVCPASYDLGEQLRVVLLSVTEGEDKPLKYPIHFQYRGCRGDHQDRSGRRRRVRSRRAVAEPRSRPTWAGSAGGVGPNARGIRQVVRTAPASGRAGDRGGGPIGNVAGGVE